MRKIIFHESCLQNIKFERKTEVTQLSDSGLLCIEKQTERTNQKVVNSSIPSHPQWEPALFFL